MPAQNGATPLYIASENGHLPVVKELLSKGASVDKAYEVHNPILFVTEKNASQSVKSTSCLLYC